MDKSITITQSPGPGAIRRCSLPSLLEANNSMFKVSTKTILRQYLKKVLELATVGLAMSCTEDCHK